MGLDRFTKPEIIGALPDGIADVVEKKILADRQNIKDAKRDWCDKVKSEMRSQEITCLDMARALGYTRQWVSSVINGTEASAPTKAKIEEFLGMTGDEHDGTAKKFSDR